MNNAFAARSSMYGSTWSRSDLNELACDRYRIPWSGGPDSPSTSPADHDGHVDVCGYRSSYNNCGFQVVVERGPLIKRLRLGSTNRVEICQHFDAPAGDELSYDYVVLLQAGDIPRRFSSSIDATLVHVDSQRSYSLLRCAVNGGDSNGNRRIASDARQTSRLALPVNGRYELRFAAAVDPCNRDTRVTLLVDNVRVTGQERTEMTLASICCAGCV